MIAHKWVEHGHRRKPIGKDRKSMYKSWLNLEKQNRQLYLIHKWGKEAKGIIGLNLFVVNVPRDGPIKLSLIHI